MTLIWALIIIGIFYLLWKGGIIEHFDDVIDEGGEFATKPLQESDYNYPIREGGAGRDSAAEGERGLIKLDRESSDRIHQQAEKAKARLAAIEVMPNVGINMQGMPESATQAMPIPKEETNNMMEGVPEPTNEVALEIAPAMTDTATAGTTIGAQGTEIGALEDSPSIQQFKSLNLSRINRIPNHRVTYQSGMIGTKTAEDEFECIAECQETPQCGMYTYQDKQGVCYMYQRPSSSQLGQFMERAPTYKTGLLNRHTI